MCKSDMSQVALQEDSPPGRIQAAFSLGSFLSVTASHVSPERGEDGRIAGVVVQGALTSPLCISPWLAPDLRAPS